MNLFLNYRSKIFDKYITIYKYVATILIKVQNMLMSPKILIVPFLTHPFSEATTDLISVMIG